MAPGLTQACGSAACAAAVSAARKRLTDRVVNVTLPGGTLHVEWAADNHILMTGPVEFEYEGVIDFSKLRQSVSLVRRIDLGYADGTLQMRKTFMSNPVVITLGCRLNAFESEVMRRHAEAAGIEDAIIVNTCAVTGEAVRQAAQTVRKLRRDKPEARIIVTGCAAQIEPERFADMPEVDHVIGNAEKMRGETFEVCRRRRASACRSMTS